MKVLKIGTALPNSEKEKMISFLRANQDVFAWKHEDMPESFNIVSTSTQNTNLYSRSGEYLHQSATKL